MSAPWWDSDYKDRSPVENRVHVGNLPWGTDERSLKGAFASYGSRSAEVSGYFGPCLLDTMGWRCLDHASGRVFPLFVAAGKLIHSRSGWICACLLVVF
jgi:hypothetical protein